jgi:hypothetical protein
MLSKGNMNWFATTFSQNTSTRRFMNSASNVNVTAWEGVTVVH